MDQRAWTWSPIIIVYDLGGIMEVSAHVSDDTKAIMCPYRSSSTYYDQKLSEFVEGRRNYGADQDSERAKVQYCGVP